MKSLTMVFLACLFMGLFSCSSSSNKVEIGFLIHSTSNSRWESDIRFLKERATELGANFTLRDAGGDENVQLKQAVELIEKGVDVLIVVPANQNTAGAIVREAHDNGVKVISYDRLIKNADLDYLISFEYEKVGELMVDYVSQIAPSGNCIVLWGDANDANAIFIKEGQERALNSLNNNQKLNIVYKTYTENWDETTAKMITSKILDFSNEKIDAVISSNVTLGMGAYKALTEHGYKPGEVVITGMDASIEFVHSMLNDGMSMTVTKPIQNLAYGAIDLAINIVNNKKSSGNYSKTVFNGRKEVPAKLFSPMVIDKSNFEVELIDKGFFTKEEIFNYNKL